MTIWKKKNSRAVVVLDEVVDHQVVVELGEVRGRGLVLGLDVAICSVL